MGGGESEGGAWRGMHTTNIWWRTCKAHLHPYSENSMTLEEHFSQDTLNTLISSKEILTWCCLNLASRLSPHASNKGVYFSSLSPPKERLYLLWVVPKKNVSLVLGGIKEGACSSACRLWLEEWRYSRNEGMMYFTCAGLLSCGSNDIYNKNEYKLMNGIWCMEGEVILPSRIAASNHSYLEFIFDEWKKTTKIY